MLCHHCLHDVFLYWEMKALPGRWNMLLEIKQIVLEPKARVYWCFHSLKKQSFRRLLSDWVLLSQHKIQWGSPKQMIPARPPTPGAAQQNSYLQPSLQVARLILQVFIRVSIYSFKRNANNRMLGYGAIIHVNYLQPLIFQHINFCLLNLLYYI